MARSVFTWVLPVFVLLACAEPGSDEFSATVRITDDAARDSGADHAKADAGEPAADDADGSDDGSVAVPDTDDGTAPTDPGGDPEGPEQPSDAPDADPDDPNVDDAQPPADDASPTDPPVDSGPLRPVNCEAALPDYDCEFSRTAYNQAVADLIYENCSDCHSEVTEGIAPLLTSWEVDDHDQMLAYVTLDDLASSPVVELVRSNHHCWRDCEENAQELQGALEDWQHRFTVRDERLAQIAEAEQRWQQSGVTDYEWHIQNGCYNCLDDDRNNALAVVSGESVVALALGRAFEEPNQSAALGEALSWHTVEGLFAELRVAVQHAPDLFDLRVDPDWGYVRRAIIDYRTDWYDEEDNYYSDPLITLGAGYCEDRGPFRLSAEEQSAARCASQEDCANCRSAEPNAAPCTDVYQRCAGQANCSSGYACVFYQSEGCPEPGSYCAPLCTAESCPEGYECADDGRCRELDCMQYPAACTDGAQCEPGAPGADRRGCVAPNCLQTGKDCGPVASCNPDAANAQPDGCAPNPCEADADCGCGSCVNGGCHIGPGVCLEVSPPPAGPLGPAPN